MTMPNSIHQATGIAPEEIPVLTHIVPAAQVPLALGVAWDARVAEKQALLDLSQELIQNMRPELDRLTTELVAQTLQGLWEKRSEKYQMPANGHFNEVNFGFP